MAAHQEGPAIGAHPSRAYRLLMAAFAAVLILPAAARAGTYDVLACMPDGVNASWVAEPGARFAAYAACPRGSRNPTKPYLDGFVVRNSVNAGIAAWGDAARMRFDAPSGATVAELTFTGNIIIQSGRNRFGTGVYGSDSAGPFVNRTPVLWGWDANTVSNASTAGGWVGVFPNLHVNVNRPRVFIETMCGSALGCDTSTTNVPEWNYISAGTMISDVRVRVSDATQPAVAGASGALLATGGSGWLRGTHAASFNASDNVGVKIARLEVDPGADPRVIRHDERACDYAQPAPCPNGGTSATYNTAGLSDGVHVIRAAAMDTAGNWTAVDRPLQVDNTAPTRPDALRIDGGEGWSPSNARTIRWATPAGQAAPIAAAHYRVCHTVTGECREGVAAGGVERADGVGGFAGPGDYTVVVWLEDAAGNASDRTAAGPVHLRYDDVVPGRAEPRQAARWLGAQQADAYDLEIRVADGDVVPVSGILGYSVTTDGSAPDPLSVEARGASATHRLAALPEGTTTVRARAISGAGVPSAAIGSASVRVDRSPPSVEAVDLPEPHVWQRSPVTVGIAAADQAHLSGMAPAADSEPTENGAHVAYRIDAAAEHRVAGARALLTLSEDGRHELAYRAVDAAGNASAERTTTVLVDRTPPERIAFEALDPRDPRRLTAVVADATSGVGGGTIEVRRRDGGPWRALDTTLRTGRLVARVADDTDLPDGDYEVRARVHDRAGNEAIGDRMLNRDEAFELSLPLRLRTHLVVSPAPGRRALTPSAVLGVLETEDGRPLAGAEVAVTARPRAREAASAAGVRRTDALGRFTYAVPPGPSRSLAFAYAGSATIQPARGELSVLVAARSTIRVDRARLRNGGTVRFTGRLAGGFVPAGGKLVNLQAFYRGRWRTFATTRTNERGAWSRPYTFQATTGRVAYRFRAQIRRELAYPFELGRSPVVTVLVTG